ncbi:MAG: hypothetical protein ACK4NW_02150 [Roseinatronobacter sp.]
MTGALIFLAVFCMVFGLIGTLIAEVTLYALTRLGWIKPRVVTVHHIIDGEGE